VNLAYHDMRHRPWRFAGITVGVSLLFTLVLSMAGIYQGLVEDATSLARAMKADLWVVQRGSYGPFADLSRLDPSVEARVAAVAGVASARSYNYQIVQRDHQGGQTRFALVGLSWPEDRGQDLPLVAGRTLAQAHGEIVVDASLGVHIGEVLRLARDDYTVVGLTRHAITTGGDAAAFLTNADSQLVLLDTASDALMTERERGKQRLRATELGRSQPALEALLVDPRWRAPALSSPPVHAVLVRVDSPSRLEQVRRELRSWPDVSVFSQAEEEQLLIQGVVQKARLQLGMFAVILLLTSAVIFAMVIYNMTLDKAHELAVLKLLGARTSRLAMMVLEQAWLMGVCAYGLAIVVGGAAFPHFPRRVILTGTILVAGAVMVAVVSSLASTLGVSFALRVDAGKALEG
jgi:putative ABC transport system permease protein